MTGLFFRLSSYASALTLALMPTLALAQEGRAHDGQLGLQQAATPIMDSITAFHNNLLLWIITGITIFVLLLMIFVMLRYNRRINPAPNPFSHNTLVEVVWVVVPVVILLVIAAPSFAVLADQMTVPDGERKYLGSNIFSWGEVEVPAPGLTVKATGYQWYWGYEYVDQDGVGFDSIMLDDELLAELKPSQPRLLAVDYEMVVPVETTVRVQVTGADVIHSFAVPSFGIKTDAVPGRLNETWFYARKEGIYYGQCSELCGKDHAFMPIAIRVVSKDEFADWIAALEESDDVEEANLQLAAVQ